MISMFKRFDTDLYEKLEQLKEQSAPPEEDDPEEEYDPELEKRIERLDRMFDRMNSFFDFADQGGTGRVKNAVTSQNAKNYVETMEKWQDNIRANNPNAINAPLFLTTIPAEVQDFSLPILPENWVQHCIFFLRAIRLFITEKRLQ